MPKILVTGAAGFIGMHTVLRLLKEDVSVIGLDNINDYYDVELKYDRLRLTGITKEEIRYNEPVTSKRYANYRFLQLNLEDRSNIERIFREEAFDYVIALGAQAGVRYSLEQPHSYTDSNITGFMNILEGCRSNNVKHLIYASTSSVYGLNTKMPFAPQDGANHPISLYAATKKANEMMAHSYSHLFQLPTTGLRFFTVYGPWGRPDMALFKFTKAILNDLPIDVYNEGKMVRDFTFVSDIVENIVRIMIHPPVNNKDWDSLFPDPSSSSAPYRIANIGNNTPVPLMKYIEAIEHAIGKKAIKNLLPMQPGDVPATHADVSSLEQITGFKPQTPVQEGVKQFVNWFQSYYSISSEA